MLKSKLNPPNENSNVKSVSFPKGMGYNGLRGVALMLKKTHATLHLHERSLCEDEIGNGSKEPGNPLTNSVSMTTE